MPEKTYTWEEAEPIFREEMAKENVTVLLLKNEPFRNIIRENSAHEQACRTIANFWGRTLAAQWAELWQESEDELVRDMGSAMKRVLDAGAGRQPGHHGLAVTFPKDDCVASAL